MSLLRLRSIFKFRQVAFDNKAYNFLAPRGYSAIMFAALFCTLLVKFFHSWRCDLLGEYISWIVGDICFLLALELVLAILCFRWPRLWMIRSATIFAAVVCTWSVMNAGWLIRTGTQILPRVLLPLVRAPLNALSIVVVNLVKMPLAAVILLVPSAFALAFFFSVLANPRPLTYNRSRFVKRVIICIVIITLTAVVSWPRVVRYRSSQVASLGLRYNSHLKAIVSLFVPEYSRAIAPKRRIPSFDQVNVVLTPQQPNYNLVVVILEGVQYRYTSLVDKRSNLTPYLNSLARQGVEFINTRSSLTHTTKALFALLTGRLPSASQDIGEAVPAIQPYASIATILRDKLDYRTAFFQSAKGDFESRPGLVHSLGFEKFWARDDLPDPNSFLGYLACDEFSMLNPITKWIEAKETPFFLTILCSVTHDPYEVPRWFATPAKEPVERYRQAISYTDKFLAAFDVELARLNLRDKTILCVIGDHGEAFGEHGQLGHALIAFDEVLRIPFCLRVPFFVRPASTVTAPVSSVDLTPTLLTLLGVETKGLGLAGINALGPIPSDRKVYFFGWMQEGPAGFVRGDRKFIYNPTNKTAYVYDLGNDPLELAGTELSKQQAQTIAEEILARRRATHFHLNQQRTGKAMVFDRWVCRWNNRVSRAKYAGPEQNSTDSADR